MRMVSLMAMRMVKPHGLRMVASQVGPVYTKFGFETMRMVTFSSTYCSQSVAATSGRNYHPF